jgi:alpha,alpha-trehalase
MAGPGPRARPEDHPAIFALSAPCPSVVHRRRRRVLHRRVVALATAILLLTGPVLAQPGGTADTTPPSIEYGPLYRAVELAGIFPDSKTFPDLVPTAPPATILRDYLAEKATSGSNLTAFVRQHFSAAPEPPGPTVQTAAPGTKLLDYVHGLWPVLTQSDPTVPAFSTLLPLPFPYVVPGGRFREVYYWDSYFTMLGLIEDGQHILALDMLKDFADEIARYNHAPNGNRSYYLSRSQPPFFSFMVALIAEHDGTNVLRTYLPQLQAEYGYWMQGATTTPAGHAFAHVVRLSDGTLLNRYWDARAAPRDESYKEDVDTAAHSNRPKGLVWRDLRAGAESGWDFSSRWLADGKTLATIRTLEIAPVDLNALLVHVEQMLARGYGLEGDVQRARDFNARAERRASAIRRLMWNKRLGAFTDYLWPANRQTGTLTAATLYPLFVHIASPYQASIVATTVRDKLLEPGGLATTLVGSGQQWDAPNGWAPLQWIAVGGLRAYGFDALAKEISTRWVNKTIAGYKQEAKLVEKYDVATTGGDAGRGGEYTTQIGFGWTNGVLLGLTSLYPDLRAEAEAATPVHQ